MRSPHANSDFLSKIGLQSKHHDISQNFQAKVNTFKLVYVLEPKFYTAG